MSVELVGICGRCWGQPNDTHFQPRYRKTSHKMCKPFKYFNNQTSPEISIANRKNQSLTCHDNFGHVALNRPRDHAVLDRLSRVASVELLTTNDKISIKFQFCSHAASSPTGWYTRGMARLSTFPPKLLCETPSIHPLVASDKRVHNGARIVCNVTRPVAAHVPAIRSSGLRSGEFPKTTRRKCTVGERRGGETSLLSELHRMKLVSRSGVPN